jgi:hypothetical protein
LASFSSCSFEMAEGFSRDFMFAKRGVEILFRQVSFLVDFKWLKVSQWLSCLVVSHRYYRGIGPRCTYNLFRSVIDRFISTSQHITLVDW